MEAMSARIIILEAKEYGAMVRVIRGHALEAVRKLSSQSTVQSTLSNLTKVGAAC
jgi:hypothetical protein